MDIRHFIPDAYAVYGEAVADAFDFFTRQVPHLRAFAGAAKSPSKPATLDQVLAVSHASPMLHKLAQVLARNRQLSPELRRALQTLESYEPRTSMADVLAVVHQELGDAAGELTIAPAALAEASVAVVVPFESGNGSTARRGVLKVLKPGVRARLEVELAAWSELGDFFAERCDTYRLPRVEYHETFEMVAELLRNEIDFEGEQAHLAEAARALRAAPGVIVPGVLPFCTRRITSMERVDGVKVTSLGTEQSFAARRLSADLVQAVIALPMFSTEAAAIFHADPHAGNLLVTREGKLALLDWAMAGRFSVADRENLAQIVLGAVMFDAACICRGIEGLSHTPDSNDRVFAGELPYLRAVVEKRLDGLRQAVLPNVSWLCGLLDDAVASAGVRLPKDLLLFRKTLLMLEGVVLDLGGDLDAGLRSAAMAQLIREWPLRAISPPHMRAFGIRLSSWELALAGWSFPASLAARLLHVGH